MKKTTQIVPLALIIVALLSSMCGCNTENTNNHNYKKEEISSTVETDNTYIEEVDTSKLSYYATYDHVAFYKGEQEQWYAYIENWGEYRKLGNICANVCPRHVRLVRNLLTLCSEKIQLRSYSQISDMKKKPLSQQ